jgi:hypothetical protein
VEIELPGLLLSMQSGGLNQGASAALARYGP